MKQAAEAVATIQRHLEAIYAVDYGHDARRFLIGDEQLARLVEAGVVTPEHQGAHEQVLVLPSDGELGLALHLSDEVQAGLAGATTLQDHCHATEGVSHLLLLLRSADRGERLRLLDLELQAEVDKASTVLLRAHAVPGAPSAERLLARLGRVTLHEDLPEEARRRYREAHRLGARYASHLAALLAEGVDRLLDELRRFYRLPPEGRRERVTLLA